MRSIRNTPWSAPLGAVALAVALALAGCGGSNESMDGAQAADTATAQGTRGRQIKNDATPPSITIGSVGTPDTNGAVTLTGQAADNVKLASITWSNDLGGSGTATMSGSSTSVNWTFTTGALQAGTNTLTIQVKDAAGNATRVTQSVTQPVTSTTTTPTLTFAAASTSVTSGSGTILSWSAKDAASCTASGAWSGTVATSGSYATGALSTTSTYALNCTGSGGTASDSVTVGVATASAGGSSTITALDFPSNGSTSADIRFRFTGSNLLPMYPATYIWRVKVRKQLGYYTTFFWGPDGAFTGKDYYGAHPYPDGGGSTTGTHKWEVSLWGSDYVTDANGNSTQLGYDVWRTQALRVWDNGTAKVHEFYWDLPDTSKVIRVPVDRSYGTSPPANAALTFGDAPWNLGGERLSGLLRGIQLYSSALSVNDILAEITTPLSSAGGSSSIWYLNLNPTPSDISDKSGKGHHPSWASSYRPALWVTN